MKTKTIVEQVLEFTKTNQRNLWIHSDVMSVYVRNARRYILKDMVKTLDIATVEVREENRGKGVFSKFIEEIHKLNPFDATYVENVQMERFQQWFVKNGWVQLGDEPTFSLSFYKLKTK